MKRKIYDELIAWKNLKSDKMPLVLYGARQIGKTWVLQEFGKNNYKNTVYVNNNSIAPNESREIVENVFNTVDIHCNSGSSVITTEYCERYIRNYGSIEVKEGLEKDSNGMYVIEVCEKCSEN